MEYLAPMDEHPLAEDPVAFPALDDAELAALSALGTRRSVAAGEHLYQAGDVGYDFFVVLSGLIEAYIVQDGVERVIVRHGPGRFLGELNLLTGLRVFVSTRVVEAGDVIAIDRSTFRRLIATSPALGNKILAAFLARRALLIADGASSLRVIGSRFSPASMRLREFLSRLRVPHQWLDVETHGDIEGALQGAEVDVEELPIVIAPGTVLRRATPGEVSDYLGLTLSRLPDRCFDLVVVGGGPAGLAAVVYGASEGLRTLGLEMTAVGGQAGASSRIENYLGFPLGISGTDLTLAALIQAEKFGAEISIPCVASQLGERAGHLVIRLSDGTEVAGRAVIAATGARYRRLDADRLEDFEGAGVHYSATKLEADMCAGAPVTVVGGGNSAGQAALFLAESGSPTTLVIRGGDVNKDMSRYLVDRILDDPRIDVRTNTQVTALEGDGALSAVRLVSPEGEKSHRCEALFSFIGAEPESAWLCGCAALDEHGFVLTDRALNDEQLDGRWKPLGRRPLPFETSQPGLFAVGDLRAGSMKRVAAAVGEGSSAVRVVHEYLAFGT